MANYEGRFLSALLKRQDMPAILGEPVDSMLETHQDIWRFINSYYSKNREMPPPAIVEETFPDFEFEEDVEGATRHHIEVLKRVVVRSRMEFLIKKSSEDLTSGKFDPNVIADRLSQRISELQKETGNARSVDIRDVDDAVSYYDRIRELSKLHDGQPGIPFGFKYMDDAYPTGLAPGHLGIVMGYSGNFKSWFTIKLLINAWMKGYNVLFINLEMSPEELRDRVYFLISQYSMADLSRADIDPDNFRAWAEDFMKGKAEFNIVGNDNFGDFSVDMVHGKIEQFKPDIVCLDYLSLFTDRERSQNEAVRMKNLSRQLKQLAMAQKIPILAIAAVTGKDKKDRLAPPHIAQVAWSSGIEYDANIAFAVHAHRNEKTQEVEKVEIVCRKNRNGDLFDFFVKMDMVTGEVKEVDEDEQAEMFNGTDGMDYMDDLDDLETV